MFSFINQYVCPMGFPRGSVVQNLPANAGRCGFDSWVGKIPGRRKWQPTPVFLPGKSHGQRTFHSPRAIHRWIKMKKRKRGMKDAKVTEAENQPHQLRHTTLDLNINKQNSGSLLSPA